MKAITTKYFGAGNTKGSRIKATDGDKNTVYSSYDHGLDIEENHNEAAQKLMAKMDWNKTAEIIASGWQKKGQYVHVLRHKVKSIPLECYKSFSMKLADGYGQRLEFGYGDDRCVVSAYCEDKDEKIYVGYFYTSKSKRGNPAAIVAKLLASLGDIGDYKKSYYVVLRGKYALGQGV